MQEGQLLDNQDHKYPNLPKSQDSQDLHLWSKLDQLQQLHLPEELSLLQLNLNYSLDSAQSHKIVQSLVYKESQGHNNHKVLDPHLSLHSVMDYHSSFKVSQDPSLFNKEGHNNLSKPSLLDHNNLKQDHHKVLQSDHHHKDSNKDPNNSGQLDLHQQDFKEDLPPLQLDFLYLIQHRSEEHDFKHCERNEKHTAEAI